MLIEAVVDFDDFFHFGEEVGVANLQKVFIPIGL